MDAFSFFKRRKSIGEYYLDFEDLVRMTRGFHEVNFRYVLSPSIAPKSAGLAPISADLEAIQSEIDVGYADAAKAIDEARWGIAGLQ